MDNLEEKIINFLNRHELTHSQKVFVVGFSGGYDSLCLLDVLNKHAGEFEYKLIAAHLNHAWRGAESDREEATARKFCEDTNIEFYTEKLSKELPHTELEARNQRYEFFNRAAKKYRADGIFTGHTHTDQAETVLYRIIKGTGLNGLRGIPEVRQQDNNCPIYRPMLDISRVETIKYCEDNSLEVNIDSSNLDERYLRNKIRLNLIPELKTYNLHIEDALVKLSLIAKDSEEIIEECISTVESDIYTDSKEINASKFLELSDAVKKQVIINFLTGHNLDYDYVTVSKIINFIKNSSSLKSGNTLSLTKDTWLFASAERIKIIYSIRANVVKSTIKVNLEGSVFHEELGVELMVERWHGEKPDKFPNERSNVAYVDLSGLTSSPCSSRRIPLKVKKRGGCQKKSLYFLIRCSAVNTAQQRINTPMYLRTRQPGDRIRPFGMEHRVKLKKYLINKGIPEFQRDLLPIMATGDEVLWVAGVGISERIRVKDIPTHILRIKNGEDTVVK